MSKITNYDRVLEWLQSFGSITQKEAYDELGCSRLSAVIYLLKKDGYKIESEVINGKNRFGDKTHWAKYILKENK